MADDETTETPDATVEVHVDAPEETPADSGDTVVVVVDDGGDSDETEHAVDVEHRLTVLEERMEELSLRVQSAVTYTEAVDVAQEAVETAAVVSEIVSEEVATETAEEVAEVVAEDVAEDVSPHKTHWLERTFGEWTGRNGSGKGSKS